MKEFYLNDTGRFILKDETDEIGALTRDFVGQKVAPQ
jgi:hypothetical protein